MKSLLSLAQAASLVLSQKESGSVVDVGGGQHQRNLQQGGGQQGLGGHNLANEWAIASNEAFQTCGIDTQSFYFLDPDNLYSDFAVFQQYASLFPDTCSEADEQIFRDAFDTFQTCSSFDVEEVLETFGDAVIGSILECALSLAPMVNDMADSTELKDMVIPDKCSDALRGKNPFGDMVRNTILYPDKVLPCFTAFSESIPQCTVEQWPVPLVGPVLTKLTCIIGETINFLTRLSEYNLGMLNVCLPEIDEDEDPMDDTRGLDCDSCQNLDGTEALFNFPFTDLGKRVAESQGLVEVIPRFEAYAKQCLPEQWHGWSYETGDYYNVARHPKPEGAQSVPKDSNDPPSNYEAMADTSSSTSDTESRFGAGIAVGFVMGLLLSTLIFAAAYCRRNRQRQNSTEKPGYDTSGSDDDDDSMKNVNIRLT